MAQVWRANGRRTRVAGTARHLDAVADALTGALVYQVLARDTAGTSTRRADGFLDVIMSGLQTTARPAQ